MFINWVNPAKSLQKRNGEVPMRISFTTETVIESDIAVLKKVRYALCPMPYALCPMPSLTSSF